MPKEPVAVCILAYFNVWRQLRSQPRPSALLFPVPAPVPGSSRQPSNIFPYTQCHSLPPHFLPQGKANLALQLLPLYVCLFLSCRSLCVCNWKWHLLHSSKWNLPLGTPETQPGYGVCRFLTPSLTMYFLACFSTFLISRGELRKRKRKIKTRIFYFHFANSTWGQEVQSLR